MAPWTKLVWVGILVSAIALLTQAVVFQQGLGGLVLAVGLPLGMASVLNWKAAQGARWALIGLVVAAVAVVIVGGLAALLAIGLSFSQVPNESLVGWLVPLVGGLAILVGSIWGLQRWYRPSH